MGNNEERSGACRASPERSALSDGLRHCPFYEHVRMRVCACVCARLCATRSLSLCWGRAPKIRNRRYACAQDRAAALRLSDVSFTSA